MKKSISIAVFLAVIVVIVIAGLVVPLGTYTTTKGCPDNITPTINLHLIRGDSIETIKANDVEPSSNVGCAINARYVLYLL